MDARHTRGGSRPERGGERISSRWSKHTKVVRFGLTALAVSSMAACSSAPVDAGSARSTTSTRTAQPSQTDPGHPCAVDAKLVPSCGVLVGVTTEKPTMAALDLAERGLPRPYDFVYRFHRATSPFPSAEETSLVQSGRLLHISVDTPPGMTWAQVADGAVDQSLLDQARGLAALGKPVWVTFDHEPDNPAKTALGSGADFVRAWRHVHDLYTSAGATNAVWVLVMIGTQPGLSRAATMYPGNDVVDWISWDVYNASGCRTGKFIPDRWQSFEASFDIFRTWLFTDGPKLGIDTSKPLMISEMGTVDDPNDPQRRVDWYKEVPQVLTKYPQVKAVGMWDHEGNGACDYRFTGADAVVDQISSLLDASATTR